MRYVLKHSLLASMLILPALVASAGTAFAIHANDRFAAIKADGTTAKGVGVTSSTRLSEGRYRVFFDRNVRPCGFIATLSQTGLITANGTPGQSTAVTLETRNSSETLEDNAFHLFVVCPNN